MPQFATAAEARRAEKAAASRRYYARNRERIIEQHREHQMRCRAKIDDIKLARGCMDCGYNDHACALDFDHRPGEIKVINIGAQMHSRRWEDIEAEISKCDVVCANCHRVRTWVLRDGLPGKTPLQRQRVMPVCPS